MVAAAPEVEGERTIQVTSTGTDVPVPTIHNSILRPDDRVDEKQKLRIDAAEARRKAGARRTAWIVAAIVVAFFIASLVQGHFVGIPNWVPQH